MLGLKAFDYDCVKLFVYCDNSFSIRCDNTAIISLFARDCKEQLLDYMKYNPNWIIVKNASIKNFANVISLCELNGLEYEVM